MTLARVRIEVSHDTYCVFNSLHVSFSYHSQIGTEPRVEGLLTQTWSAGVDECMSYSTGARPASPQSRKLALTVPIKTTEPHKTAPTPQCCVNVTLYIWWCAGIVLLLSLIHTILVQVLTVLRTRATCPFTKATRAGFPFTAGWCSAAAIHWTSVWINLPFFSLPLFLETNQRIKCSMSHPSIATFNLPSPSSSSLKILSFWSLFSCLEQRNLSDWHCYHPVHLQPCPLPFQRTSTWRILLLCLLRKG